MDPYERVMCAIRHQQPDRPPIDYAATPEFNDALKKFLGVNDDAVLLQQLGVDIRRVKARFVGPSDMTAARGRLAVGKDFFGIVREPVQHAYGFYNEIVFHPLARATTVKEVEEYPWPEVDWFDFSDMSEDIARINGAQRYAIMYDRGGGAFEHPWYLRGLERFLMDLVECPDIAEAISYHVVKFFKELDMRAVEESNGQIDIISSGGDIGTQRGMMLSPELWRRHIKPYSRELIRPFKDIGIATYYHSCGSILPVIEDFIEMGLDILDPIQPKAVGMEPEGLKERFGDRLTFHGGIDEQDLLPSGTPEEVRREAGRIIRILGREGGYIVCPAHAIQPDTPVENIVALYETAREF